MRTVEEIRTSHLRLLQAALARPEMHAVCGSDYEGGLRTLMGILCFIDERGPEGKDSLDRLLHSHGESGVAGAFKAMFEPDGPRRDPYLECRFQPEIASVYARAALRLGYSQLERRLAEAEWGALRESLPEYDSVDCRLSDIVARFGKPGLTFGKRILFYAPEGSDDEWVCFDCFENPAPSGYAMGKGTLDHKGGWPRDPLLRDIRMPAKHFADSFVLTAWGKFIRWGPSWWIHHPKPDSDAKTAALASQLRHIAENDPSQSLGPRRP